MMIAPALGPEPRARAQETHDLEHPQRLTNARSADAERGRELALGRKAVSGGESAVEEVGFDLLEHDLPSARCFGHETPRFMV
jgi:hypothetical protein